MRAKGKFKFKEIRRTEAGSFIDKETKKEVSYKPSYKLIADEIDSDGIHERIFKLEENSVLIPQLQKLEPYTDIVIEFDVKNYASGIRLLPIAVATTSKQ